jgi:hypothetical protein
LSKKRKAYQSDNNWSEPNLVTTELGDVLNGSVKISIRIHNAWI